MLLELPIIIELRKTLANFGANPIFFLCLFILIPFSLICSFICLLWIFRKIKLLEKKTVRMRELSSYIQRGATVYLKQQSKMLFIVLAILFIPVGFTGIQFLDNPFIGFFIVSAIFLIGAISSLFAGYIGMRAATKANILVIEASMEDPNEGFKLAYYGGMITGILNISIFILGIWLILIFTNNNIYLMISYDFGASVAALLAQVGGGIFTKSADMGADLVGKYELGIKEDDPSNPAIIADLVGDNVGDCAGRGADLFESASSDAIGGMILGLTLFLFIGDPIFIISDLTLISLGVFSLIFTTLFLKVNFEKPSKSIWRVFIAATLFNVFILLIMNLLLFGSLGIFLFLSSVIGLIAVFIAIIFTIYYTSIEYKHTKNVAEASQDGPSINIISGLSAGFSSIFIPVIIFGVAVLGAYFFGYLFGSLYYKEVLGSKSTDIFGNEINLFILLIAFGIWGVNMASVSSDIIISTILSFDTFGPIVDNSAGIVELGGDEAPVGLRENLDKLDAIGNTTKAVAKGFALICGGLSSIVMFFAFLLSTHTLAGSLPSIIPSDQLSNIFYNISLYNPLILMGILIGFMLPIVFSALILKGVQRGSMNVVHEVRRQYNEIPGLKEGKAKPDYDRCVNISAKNALQKMMQPILIVISITLLIGILFGPMVIAGLLIGNLIGCLIFGLFMSIGGASFDNAKKGIEAGLYGGKGSFAHKAAIIGDTVGDPLKDTAGPSMNILITTINTMAITFLPIFIMTGFFYGLFPF
ncbi:MAG: sodium-translocating pyrophosphatase [Promethearchaeota archaeon]